MEKLPPLSLEVLSEVERIENVAQGTINLCWNQSSSVNFPRAMRNLRVCAVASFRAQLPYYAALEGFCPEWLDAIKHQVVESIMERLPFKVAGFHRDQLEIELRTTIEDQGKRELKSLPSSRAGELVMEVAPEPAPVPSVGVQIRMLRQECRMTIEDLAGEVGLASRNVRRHEAGESQVRDKNLSEYERVFSKRLNRRVRIVS